MVVERRLPRLRSSMFRVSAGFGGIVFALVYAEVLLLLGVLGRTLCWRNANALLMRGARRGGLFTQGARRSSPCSRVANLPVLPNGGRQGSQK